MKLDLDPKEDGITHINIYSKSKTELGRFLSNFYPVKIDTEDEEFASIEGYWYWLSSKDDTLRTLSEYEAKKYGQSIDAEDWLDSETFRGKIKKAIVSKIWSNPKYVEMLKAADLPFVHYYIFKGKVVLVPKTDWIVDFIHELRIPL